MSNKLHLFNRVLVGVAVGFTGVFLIVLKIIQLPVLDEVVWIFDIVTIILMAVYIFVQENNTNNFVRFDLHKRFNQSKKSLNQTIGFVTTWFLISCLWLSISLDLSITVYLIINILLILIQNALSYTTFGQSKYWNFTYEGLLVVHILSLGLFSGIILVTLIGILLGTIILFRQWKEMKYNKLSQVIGFVLYFIFMALMTFGIVPIDFSNMMLTDITAILLLAVVGVFGIVYFVQNPKVFNELKTK